MKVKRSGFTLVELLVVIGIITILISILIPVVGKVRLSAQTANSQNEMVRISTAIQAYFNDFNAYPGTYPNGSFAGTRVPNPPIQSLTQSEDLVLALLGGLTPNFNNGALTGVTFDANNVGNGPASFNGLNPGQKNAYLAKTNSDLSNGALKLAGGPAYSNMQGLDSIVPEFMDQFSDPRPILYIRASLNAKANDANSIVSDQSGAYQSSVTYNFGSAKPYLLTGATGDPMLSLGVGDSRVKAMFTSGTGNTARGFNSFILISSGRDRKFGPDPVSGTNDDLIYTSGGGQ